MSKELKEMLNKLRDDAPLPPFYTVGQLKDLLQREKREARIDENQRFIRLVDDAQDKYKVPKSKYLTLRAVFVDRLAELRKEQE